MPPPLTVGGHMQRGADACDVALSALGQRPPVPLLLLTVGGRM